MKTKSILGLFVIMTLLILTSVTGWSAEPGSGDVEVIPDPMGIVALLTPVVAMVATFLTKMALKLPGWAIPVLATVIGGVYSMIMSYIGAGDMNVLVGAALGLAATGLHQIKAQLSKPQ